jgi:tetratricopeptide (TPR) repeat protein
LHDILLAVGRVGSLNVLMEHAQGATGHGNDNRGVMWVFASDKSSDAAALLDDGENTSIAELEDIARQYVGGGVALGGQRGNALAPNDVVIRTSFKHGNRGAGLAQSGRCQGAAVATADFLADLLKGVIHDLSVEIGQRWQLSLGGRLRLRAWFSLGRFFGFWIVRQAREANGDDEQSQQRRMPHGRAFLGIAPRWRPDSQHHHNMKEGLTEVATRRIVRTPPLRRDSPFRRCCRIPGVRLLRFGGLGRSRFDGVVDLTRRWGRMRRNAVRLGFMATLLAASAGCATVASREDRLAADPAESAARRQLSQIAQAAIDRKDWAAARDALVRLVARAPKSAEAQLRLGRVLQAQGQLPAAEAAYQAALLIDPEYNDALIGLAEVEAARGRLQAALNHLLAAIEINPHRASAHLAQGRVFESLGRTDEALAAYFRALKYDSGSPQATLRIATIQLDRHQPDQALARLAQVLELNPDDPEVRHQRGRAHLVLNHAQDAIDDLRFAARLLPNRADIYSELALALDRGHRSSDALQAAQHALSLNPNDTIARDLTIKLRR